MAEFFYTVVNGLPKLSQAQLQEVKARCQVLLKGGVVETAPVSGASDDAEIALMAICDYMTGKGLDFTRYAALRKSQQYSAFKEHACDVVNWWRKVSGQRVELDVLVRYGIDLVCVNLQTRGWSVTSRTIMRSFYEVPSLVSKAFPAYQEAGMLGVLLEAKIKQGKELEHVRKKRNNKAVLE